MSNYEIGQRVNFSDKFGNHLIKSSGIIKEIRFLVVPDENRFKELPFIYSSRNIELAEESCVGKPEKIHSNPPDIQRFAEQYRSGNQLEQKYFGIGQRVKFAQKFNEWIEKTGIVSDYIYVIDVSNYQVLRKHGEVSV